MENPVAIDKKLIDQPLTDYKKPEDSRTRKRSEADSTSTNSPNAGICITSSSARRSSPAHQVNDQNHP